MECGVLATARERHFKADNIRDVFENINMEDVLSFNGSTKQSTKYKNVLSNKPTQNHISQQLQLVVCPLWPGVMVPVGVLLVGGMDENMNLKEKWVYEAKVSSYKKWLQIIYNSYMSTGFGIE